MEIHKIAVGVDFSSESDAAVEHALELARSTGAEMVLVHVCPIVDASREPEEEGSEWLRHMREQLTANRDRLEEMRSTLLGQGVEISHAFVDERPAEGLLRCAEGLGVDLVCVGTHGHTGLERLLLGSVAERVIRDSQINTLVVRGSFRPRGGYKRILVPTDFSPSSDAAVAAAADLVGKGGCIDVRHFWPPPSFGPVVDPNKLRRRADARAEQRGAQLLVEYKEYERFEMTFEASHGNPKRAILELLDGGDYDLVLMGSHGRHGLTRWILGSVAEVTVRHAPCSVMVMKEIAEKLSE